MSYLKLSILRQSVLAIAAILSHHSVITIFALFIK